MTRATMYHYAVAGLALMCCVAQPAAAVQMAPTLGGIAGVVTQASDGSVVQGARVVLLGTRLTGITNASGEFELTAIPAGEYELLVDRDLLAAERRRIVVAAGAVTRIAINLSLGWIREDLTVTATAGGTESAFDAFNSVRSLDGIELAKARGPAIADALVGEPGVSARSFGANNSRPMIRGFDGDRVLVLKDGLRTGDLSSTSADHQVAIETAALDRVEVVRGPAVLLYGSNAMGGVVNAITLEETLRASRFRGQLATISVDAGSANAMAGLNATFDRGFGPWLMWAGVGGRRAGDYRTPDGTVRNSGLTRRTARAGAGWTGKQRFASVEGEVERNRFGVPVIEEDSSVRSRGRREAIRADVGSRQLKGPFANLHVNFASVRYRQDETETSADTVTLGTSFDNTVRSIRAELQQKPTAPMTGRIGFEWLDRRFFSAGKEALAPRTHQQVSSLFAYEEAPVGRVRLQVGGRLERIVYSPEERAGDHEPNYGRVFHAMSGSAGLNVDVGAAGALIANITRTSRAPALEELYNFGADAGNGTFEIGNPGMAVERTLGLDLSFRRRSGVTSTEFNAFAYYIDNFVFLDVTREMVGALRRAVYTQARARFLGLESSLNARLGAGVRLRAGASYVDAELTDTRQPLPRIPPLSGRVGIAVPWKRLSIEPRFVMTAAQSRVFRAETPTHGWATADIHAVYVLSRQRVTHIVTVAAHNLANRSYRIHTSFLKDVAPEMGRGLRVTYTIKLF